MIWLLMLNSGVKDGNKAEKLHNTYLKFLRPHHRQKKYLLKNAEDVTLEVTASAYIPNW